MKVKITLSIFVLLFCACGNTPKIDPPVEKKPIDQIQACGPRYDPLVLQRTDLFPIQDLSTLPMGRYSHNGIEMVFRQQDNISKEIVAVGHFSESMRDNSVLLSDICKSNVPTTLISSVDFTGLKSFTQRQIKDPNDQPVVEKAISKVQFLVTLEKGKMNIGRVLNNDIEAAGLEKILEGVSAWRLYQVKENAYELRTRAEKLVGNSIVITSTVQEILYAPN